MIIILNEKQRKDSRFLDRLLKLNVQDLYSEIPNVSESKIKDILKLICSSSENVTESAFLKTKPFDFAVYELCLYDLNQDGKKAVSLDSISITDSV
jgi:hypothetical protein